MTAPTPHSWQKVVHGLGNVQRLPEFATGTHVEVFGRNFGPWQWLGAQEGHEEHLHAWVLPHFRWWLMLAVPARLVVYADGGVMETSPVRTESFDEAGPGTRQHFVDQIREHITSDREFAGLATKTSLHHPWATNVDADRVRVARLRALSAWAQTDDEKAVAFLFALTGTTNHPR